MMGSLGDGMKRSMNDSKGKVAFMPPSRAYEPWCWIVVCLCRAPITSRASGANRPPRRGSSLGAWHLLDR